MREESAAGVPLFFLLLFAALEGVASRTWAVALVIIGGFALLALALWHTWPREDERVTIRRILREHPEWRCPMCGGLKAHKRDCPIL